MEPMTDVNQALQSVARELEDRIEKMGVLLRQIGYFNSHPEKLEAPVFASMEDPKRMKSGDPGQDQSTVENVRRILVGLGDNRGLPTRELLIYLEEFKCPVKGKRPIQTLYGILYKESKSKHPRVRRNEKGNWEAV
jgi:hypothetical protein